MPRQLISQKYYNHLERVEWPEDLLGPNWWRPKHQLIWDLSKELQQTVGRVTASGIRFYQKVKHLPAPCIPGDNTDPDTIHALLFALNRQDELETLIKASNEHQNEPLKEWLQDRKKSHVKSMQAVVVAEEGEMYDLANRQAWEVKMTKGQVDHLRFIFRTVMARIDIAPAAAGEWDAGKVQPICKEATVQVDKASDIVFPGSPPVSFWKDDALIENSDLKIRQAAMALYHQGRVLSACWARLGGITPSAVMEVAIRAMHLTMRSIDLVWIRRQQDLPKEEEERLLAWLRERKTLTVELRFALIAYHLPTKLYDRKIKIDYSGAIFEKKKDGGYVEWGGLEFGPSGTL